MYTREYPTYHPFQTGITSCPQNILNFFLYIIQINWFRDDKIRTSILSETHRILRRSAKYRQVTLATRSVRIRLID